MEFSPNNKIIKRCIQGMEQEDAGKLEEARDTFLLAWNEASNDFEKYIAAFFVSRTQNNVTNELAWLEAALQHAQNINNDAVISAYSSLYSKIASCYQKLNNHEKAQKNYDLAIKFKTSIPDKGPFYHGTKADLHVGDLLKAGSVSNYKSDFVMSHIYFTALTNGAGLAASLAKGEGKERVYIVEPTGSFENDSNVTNKKFPGNPTRSYRSEAPLKIVGEITDWLKQTPEEIQKWHEKLKNNNGKIIN